MIRRFHFVRQRDSMQCGVACLAMIARHYGGEIDLHALESLCDPTAEGVSMKGIADAAREIGLDSLAARTTLSKLKRLESPAILHWNQNHFVVLYRISRDGTRFHIADPGKGKYVLPEEEFRSHWEAIPGKSSSDPGKGLMMLFEPEDDFHQKVAGYRTGKLSWQFLFGYINRYRSYFIQVVLGLLLGCMLQLAFPFLTQSIVDVGIHNADIGFIWLILLGELMILVGSTLTGFIRSWLLLHISMRINISMVSDFLIKIMKLPMNFFEKKLMGDLLQRISDHSRVERFLTEQTLNVIFSVMSLIVFSCVLLIYNSTIFLIYAGGTLLSSVWISIFLRRRRVLDYEIFEQQAINSNRTYQLISSMQEIKLQNCEQRRRWEWEDVQASLFSLRSKSLRLQQSQDAGMMLINELKNILVTVMAATDVISGGLSLGGMLAIQYIIGQLNSPVDQLLGFIYTLQDVRISLERINEIRQSPEEEKLTHDGQSYADNSQQHGCKDIEIRDLDFRYDRHSPLKTLSGISISIPKGKVTAVVGASGSGKSTLIKLILGYYLQEKGEILIGGENLKSLRLVDWRRRCGVVMQDGVIFSDTIAGNIAVSDGEPDSDRIRRAARVACIDDYIDRLPLGYATRIGPDGRGLSLGQKQRILIARAVYRDPDFIFFDEATNSLDAKNERDIVENLDEFFVGRTVVVVAHRLSTVRNADNIIVMKNGSIAEQGNHEQLTALRGEYYNLVKNQLELGS
ncbi:MAG: peptidase domain-containing ABC transporter [Muribaculaceae bacterium]|nr:peptidase domain-containing ABC transporter [Muribaculaceae bacterium]